MITSSTNMDAFLQQFQHLKIQLQEITSATNNFNDQNNCIGVGGFGKVYKGEVSHSKGRSMVAIKRLDPKHGQGIPEFLKEITTLSRYSHKNLVSLVGFCYQGDEMILVYEHASRGSLDSYLNSPNLAWSQRIKICLDAAKGLNYLHDPGETHQRLIHCDIKSANILLDEQLNAKVSDFGLSIMGPANEECSVIVTPAAGTHGYCDPQYAMTHTLTKESDVYSFGVVLFEVLCGRLCCTYSNGRVQQNLVRTWIESYEEKKLSDIIFKDPAIQPLDKIALETFSDIAYQCLKQSREDRPKMAEVVTELAALENQVLLKSEEFSKWKEQLFYYEEIVKTAPTPLNYGSEIGLMKLLYKGVLLNGGKTYFSLNKKGEHCEMISIAECMGSEFESHPEWAEYNSRFAVGTYEYSSDDGILKTHVKSQFLSPGITYTVNLVFNFSDTLNLVFNLSTSRKCDALISLEYRLQGETESLISPVAYEREDGWWMCELYQFTTDHRIVDLQILFDCFLNHGDYESLEVEGIEFRPLGKVEHKDENQPISDSDSDSDADSDADANWEEKMPTDYEDIMKRSEDSLQWTTKEEAYSILRKGFFIRDGTIISDTDTWFSLDKNGKKCHMLSSTKVVDICSSLTEIMCSPKSRFGKVAQDNSAYICIRTEIESQLLSSETTYACYLVYKLPEDQSRFKAPVKVEDFRCVSRNKSKSRHVYLTTPPPTPIIRPKAGQNTRNPLNRLKINLSEKNRQKIKGLPQQRNDGWMEVQIWELQADTTIIIHLLLSVANSVANKKNFSGLLIDGIEFRPI